MKNILLFGVGLKTFNKFKQKEGMNRLWSLNKLKIKTITKLKFYNYLQNVKKKKGHELKKSTNNKFNFLRKIKNYRFFRHRFNRPVRGQRTKTNAKTQKKIRRS